MNCIYSAQQLLFVIFGLRLLINLQGIFLPYLRCSNIVCCTAAKERSADDDKTEGRDERQPLQTGQSNEASLCTRLCTLSHRSNTVNRASAAPLGSLLPFNLVLPLLLLTSSSLLSHQHFLEQTIFNSLITLIPSSPSCSFFFFSSPLLYTLLLLFLLSLLH